MKRRLFALTTAVVIGFSMTGCGGTQNNTSNGSTAQQTEVNETETPLLAPSAEGGLTATFDKTDAGSGAGSGITIDEGKYLAIDSKITEGKVQVIVKHGGSDINTVPTEDDGTMPTIDHEFDSTGITEYHEIEPGDYMVFVNVSETASGTMDFIIKSKEDAEPTGEDVPLKDTGPEAERLIEEALQKKIAEDYGDDVAESVIRVDKVYSASAEQETEPVKEMNLGADEVAFEASFDLKPSEGADVNMLLIPNGEFDEVSGWVKGVTRLGVLRPSDNGGYVITDYGTGW